MTWRRKKTRNKNRERLVAKEYRGRLRPSRQSLDSYLLELWGQVIRLRDGHRCRRCKRPGPYLQGHHVHRRNLWGTRHDPDNGLTLCRACHRWWHLNREIAYDWFVEMVGADFAAILKVRAYSECKNPDLQLRVVFLTQKLEAWGASSGRVGKWAS